MSTRAMSVINIFVLRLLRNQPEDTHLGDEEYHDEHPLQVRNQYLCAVASGQPEDKHLDDEE